MSEKKLPNYYEAEMTEIGLMQPFDETSTPFSWICDYCGYPRRITEMITTDQSAPCIFCYKKLEGKRGVKIRIVRDVISAGGIDIVQVDAMKVGINSQNPPIGTGGDDSELLTDNEDHIFSGALKRYEEKIQNLRQIFSHINALSGSK